MEKTVIIIPAYNEEKRIGRTLEYYGKFFSDLKSKKLIDVQILVVINNTKDRTEDVVRKYQKKYKIIEYLNFKQGGKGFAVIEGFKEALKNEKNSLIGFVDADLATKPDAFYDLIKNIKNHDGVIASRWIKGSVVEGRTLKKIILSFGFNFIVRSLFLFKFHDTQCGAKLFRKEAITKVKEELKLTQWAFDVNLLYLCKKYGFDIIEIPTVWQDQEESKIKPSTPIQMFSGVIRLRIINSPLEPLARQIKIIAKFGDWLINKRKKK